MKKGLLLLLSLSLFSCSNQSSTFLSSTALDDFTFQDKELKENIIDDNYRNYYEIFVASFADSNGDGIGDLDGITAKIPYLRDIGYTGLWLTPIYKSLSYHKYDVDDYYAIDEDFGTFEDLDELIREAHANDMKVILDLPLNHTGQYNNLFSKAVLAHKKEFEGEELTEEEKIFSSLYVFYDSLEEAQASNNKYYRCGANDFYYEANFSSNMPEFNFENEYIYTIIDEITSYYQDLGIDGFRLDAVKYFDINNTENNVKILSRINEIVKSHDPDAYIVGECWDNEMTISNYYKSGIDSFFYFPGSSAFAGSYLLSNNMSQNYKNNYLDGLNSLLSTSDPYIPAPFIDNHDMGRASKSGRQDLTKFQLGLLGMSNGTTFTYYGDEIGMTSQGSDDQNYRTHYYFDDETHEYECDNPNNGIEGTKAYAGANQQLEDPNSILNYAKKINLLRNSFKSIARGKLTALSSEDEKINEDTSTPLLIIDKEYEEEKIKIVINFAGLDNDTYLVPEGYDVCSVVLVDINNKAELRGDELTLPPYAIAIMKGE